MTFRSVALVGVENCAYSFDNLFSYLIPDKLLDLVLSGTRVMVPFGNSNKLRQGFVYEIKQIETENALALKEISHILDTEPLLSDEMIKLAKWLKDRCFCTYFVAAKSLLPGGMCMKTEKIYACSSDILPEIYDSLNTDEKSVIDFLRKKNNFVRESVLLKKLGLTKDSLIHRHLVKRKLIVESSDAFKRVSDLSVQLVRISDDFIYEERELLTEKQKSVIETLKDIGAATVKEITYFSGVSDSVIKTLIGKGICEVFSAPIKRELNYPERTKVFTKPVLSVEQQSAFDDLSSAYKNREYKSALLYGVTGSGKTSVYLQLIDTVLTSGKNVIVLVPEISLTPQTFNIFTERYGKDIAVLHSGLSMGERHDEWKRIHEGNAKVIIGTRSAVFAPVDNLGLIIIDEEQEHTYKSEMSPRYNAKDVAKFRCAYHNAFLLLASATPSIETYAKAKQGLMLLCELKNRFGKAQLPEVFAINMTDKNNLTGFFAISNPLAAEIEHNLKAGEQTILLVNRRGYNTFVVCSECKKVVSCPKCSISMTYHSANNRLMCHYCGYTIPYTSRCPDCDAENIRYSGFGTQRVEQELKIRFPQAKIIRMDADTTSTKNSHEKVLNSFATGEYDILIGTQMVAKGLDFPDVTLVGITSADKELYNNNFRSAERSFDLITQVVGRAGRGGKKGRAVIQTVSPDNPIISIASKQDYVRFFNNEIALRKALTYPPFCDLCEINFSGRLQEKVIDCATHFFNELVKLNSTEYSEFKIIVLGPMAPRVSKINEFYRQRILIKCKNTVGFREFIDKLLIFISKDKNFKDITVYADMNPENLN